MLTTTRLIYPPFLVVFDRKQDFLLNIDCESAINTSLKQFKSINSHTSGCSRFLGSVKGLMLQPQDEKYRHMFRNISFLSVLPKTFF